MTTIDNILAHYAGKYIRKTECGNYEVRIRLDGLSLYLGVTATKYDGEELRDNFIRVIYWLSAEAEKNLAKKP